MKHLLLFSLAASLCIFTCAAINPPKPYGPLPTKQQLAWQDMETNLFVHFTVNTFTDKEWGYGDENPDVFNPTALDCRQWAKAAKDAGFKGIILTAKHHDGFCLWPSKYTEHSVKYSKWRNGQGDVLRELRKACDEYGLKMGVYLSPWDRNSAKYGMPDYITYYRNQLKELTTEYGNIFEVWFDGANGGDGYYGGAKEKRTIDRKTYYDWTNTRKVVRDNQPDAVMFGDGGPDIRWVGNESGMGSTTNWCLLNADTMYAGGDYAKFLGEGQEYGKYWVPAEVDVSIRKGWFFHENEEARTAENILNLFYQSVGRNSNLLLNIPPNRQGLFAENDIKSLIGFKKLLDQEFKNEVKPLKVISGFNRGKEYAAQNMADNNPNTYWATKDNVTTASAEFDFGKTVELNRVLIQEYIQLGQRVKKFKVEAFVDGQWKLLTDGTTIGHKVIKKCELTKTTKVRLTIEEAKACPVISNVKFYLAPMN